MSVAQRLFFLAFLTFLCTCGPAQMSAQKKTVPLYQLDHLVEIELEMHDEHWKKKLNAWKKELQSKRVTATLKPTTA